VPFKHFHATGGYWLHARSGRFRLPPRDKIPAEQHDAADADAH
jgi:hypothetical protein